MIVIFVVLFVVCSLIVPYFFTIANMRALALAVSMTGMVAATMMFCLSVGDFDLSVEAIVALAGVSAAVLMRMTGCSIIGVIGGIVGLSNGLIISYLNINALITTLAIIASYTWFTGVILASRMTSGEPNTSVGFSLDVISACVLGGVFMSGGIVTISGVIVGVLIMGIVQNVMNLLNIQTFYQYVVRGLILLLAVLFDQLKQIHLSKA